MLVNNNYSSRTIDRKIELFINNKFSESSSVNPTMPKSKIKLYYRSQFHPNYKIDERVMKEIVNNNVKPIDQQSEISLIIYYKNKKTHNLIMKNNSAPPPPIAQRTNVVYNFNCPLPHGEAVNYIGLTTTTLYNRMSRHVQSGSIKRHFEESHHTKPTRSQILDNTTILSFAENKQKLYIKEALHILQENPKINRQYDNFTNILKLYKSRNPTTNNRIQYNQPSLQTNPSQHLAQDPTIAHQASPRTNPSQHLAQDPAIAHQASPQITLRINQLIANSRGTPSVNLQEPIINTPEPTVDLSCYACSLIGIEYFQ